MARRHTRVGRQKLRIRRIEIEHARRFSKVRDKVFNKAAKLAILHGVEVAAIVFSPAGKPFSFGSPSVEAVLQRFAPTRVRATKGRAAAGEHNNMQELADLYQEHRELCAKLGAAKARLERAQAARAKKRAAGNRMAAWLEADIRDMGEDELMEFEAALQKMQECWNNRAVSIIVQSSVSSG